MTQCMTVGCPGAVNFTGGLEGGMCLYTFVRNMLAAFACRFPDAKVAEQLAGRWQAKYGKLKSTTDWKGLQMSFPRSVIGGAWQDSRTRATIAEAGITLEDLAANNAMRAAAAKIAAEGPKGAVSEEQNGTESAPWCDQVGDLVETVGNMRDQGIDEPVALASARGLAEGFYSGKQAGVMKKALSSVIVSVYAHPETTPDQARAQWLLQCYTLYPTGSP